MNYDRYVQSAESVLAANLCNFGSKGGAVIFKVWGIISTLGLVYSEDALTLGLFRNGEIMSNPCIAN